MIAVFCVSTPFLAFWLFCIHCVYLPVFAIIDNTIIIYLSKKRLMQVKALSLSSLIVEGDFAIVIS